MLNREIKVDLVKKSKSNENEISQSDIGFEEKAKIISGIVETSVKRIGLIVCAYVLLDTVRKVAIVSFTP